MGQQLSSSKHWVRSDVARREASGPVWDEENDLRELKLAIMAIIVCCVPVNTAILAAAVFCLGLHISPRVYHFQIRLLVTIIPSYT
jgi:hypothetical protein